MSEINDERVRNGISEKYETNVATVEPVLTPYDEVFEMNDEFNLDGFQVVIQNLGISFYI